MATNWNEEGERYLPQALAGKCRSDAISGVNDTIFGLRFRVDNFAHVRAAYGARVASEVMRQISRIISELMDGVGLVQQVSAGILHVDAAAGLFGGQPWPVDACAAWIDKVCASLPHIPLSTSGGRILVWLSGAPIRSGVDLDDFSYLPVLAPFAADPIGRDAGWVSRYLDDMEIAAAVVDQMAAASAAGASNSFALCWQPIRCASDDDDMLYAEGLLRFIDKDGQAQSAGKAIAALERIGFARPFDRHVANLVFAELERHPELSLGLNISAQSACWDIWWEDYAARLRAAPAAAKRLVIEITETTPIADIFAAVKFVSRMRRLGCRIALDDFGAGHMSLRYMWALAPHIVKIDRMFLAKAQTSEAGRQTYFHLAKLAQSAGATVVAEGVETRALAVLATEMGVECQQGYHWGQPTFSNIWSSYRFEVPAPIAAEALATQSAITGAGAQA